MLLVVLVVMVGIITPADISFGFPKNRFLEWFFRVSDILFVLDIFIRFNTSYPVGRRRRFEMSRAAIRCVSGGRGGVVRRCLTSEAVVDRLTQRRDSPRPPSFHPTDPIIRSQPRLPPVMVLHRFDLEHTWRSDRG